MKVLKWLEKIDSLEDDELENTIDSMKYIPFWVSQEFEGLSTIYQLLRREQEKRKEARNQKILEKVEAEVVE